MSANTCIIVFFEEPEGGGEPMCWWGDDPHTALPTQLVALSLTLCVYLSVFAALRTTKHYSPSHMPSPSFFCQPNLKRARCGQKRPNVIVLRHKCCIVLGFCRLRPSQPRLLLPHLFFYSWQMHARPFVLFVLQTWMSISECKQGMFDERYELPADGFLSLR